MKENIPQFLQEMLINEYGEDLFNKIINGYSKKRKTTFRVNTLKASVHEIENVLNVLNIKFTKCTWNDNAFIIETDYKLQDLDIYKEGKIYLQSLSSMIPANVLNPKERRKYIRYGFSSRGKDYSDSHII